MRTEHGRLLCVAQDLEVKAYPKVPPEIPLMEGAIAIAIGQEPEPEPLLVAEPCLAVAVEVVVAITVEAKVDHLLQTLVLREVPR